MRHWPNHGRGKRLKILEFSVRPRDDAPINAQMAEWSKAEDCKSFSKDNVGSNPTLCSKSDESGKIFCYDRH